VIDARIPELVDAEIVAERRFDVDFHLSMNMTAQPMRRMLITGDWTNAGDLK
jgi:hypothetical protein